ncbi:LLM class flavin-dependent oxidoreductase [Streptomyces fuscichromogenes]|uniref:LLM class flavin-dependent oxidoreductase n=1 Tax=Streptomyces fuscichromogenes TaxID=1324013 RepID=UPI003825D31B
MSTPLSILDLAYINPGETAGDSFRASVDLARHAEEWGYRRIWYAEHHNMSIVGSSAPSVLIAHVAAQTRTIRLGAGGIMLPNHAPLSVAEQFGTLETLYPGRIDLGLGRAPGGDRQTLRALRRDPQSGDTFPEDVLELQGYLTGRSRIQGVDATPGKGTDVPLYILGSSVFGAGLAAALGLPFAFASHFAPAALDEAVSLYRREFQPSEQLDAPHVIVGVNVVAADTAKDAREHLLAAQRRRVIQLLGRAGVEVPARAAEGVLETPAGKQVLQHVEQEMACTAVGTPTEVKDYLDRFTDRSGADELIVASLAVDRKAWLRSLELLADVSGTAGA